MRYCSLDIETTGFDPLKDEILEVGFAFFTISSSGIKIIEEWTQVFKPIKEVAPKILGLTGIKAAELENAPKFAEFQNFIQEKIGNATIVGHNVIFDIKFLQSVGIKFFGQVIDTLDLVQWLLPTRHSYNLENLMHYFKVPHKEAHRALADSKAVILMLEKFLEVFQNFPQELKQKIRTLINPFNFAWEEMLKINLPKKDIDFNANANLEINKKPTSEKFQAFVCKPKTICDFPLGFDYLRSVIEGLKTDKKKYLLVLPKKQQVMHLWKNQSIRPVFLRENLFNEKKFQIFINKQSLSLEELKFALKILVWQATNWQNESLLDLNLSFFGGQFRQEIVGSEFKEDKENKILVCDMETFCVLAEKKLYKDRFAAIFGLPDFEAALSNNISQKVSWGYINYILKSFYNPENNTGNEKLKEAVSEILNHTDLFFGLVGALLSANPPGFQYYKINEENLNSANFQKTKSAAESYLEKLKKANKALKSEELKKTAENLESFFKAEDNRVKWIELAENRCVFQNSLVSLSQIVKPILKIYKNLCFLDCLGSQKVARMFIQRLDLEKFKYLEIGQEEKLVKEKKIQRLDLFSAIKSRSSVNCIIHPKAMPHLELYDLLDHKSLPAVALMPNLMEVKDFYENYFHKLQESAYVLTQNASGGSNKLFRNFEIYKETVLLVTDKFLLKFLNEKQNNGHIGKLEAKTLIINHLPFEQFTHPYLEAVAQKFENPFEDFSLPKAVYNFHKIIQFCYTQELRTVIVADSKLAKGYAREFIDYLGKISNFDIK